MPQSAAVLRKPGTLVAGLLLGATLGATVAVLLAVRSAAPREDSPEAGFARDMATHHAQAVEMSFDIRDKSSDEVLRTLAYDIIVTQSAQRGVFMGWLQAWGLRQASAGARMAWMPGHPHGMSTDGGALMHGMASDAEMKRLQAATGSEAEILFLQLMIRHHEGGVIMARALTAVSDRAEVVAAAKHIEDGQRAEIAQMTAMLAARHAQPYRSLIE
jgi:uncharacterized protein (DUF305 family)